MHIQSINADGTTNWTIFNIIIGNYNGMSIAAIIQEVLIPRFPDYNFQCFYQQTKGIANISVDVQFRVLPDDLQNYVSDVKAWTAVLGNPVTADYRSLQPIKDVFRHTKWLDLSTPFNSEILDLTSVHSIYLHCTNLEHFNSVGVRGQSDIINKQREFKFRVSNFR